MFAFDFHIFMLDYFLGIHPDTHSEGMFSWFPIYFPIKVSNLFPALCLVLSITNTFPMSDCQGIATKDVIHHFN